MVVFWFFNDELTSLRSMASPSSFAQAWDCHRRSSAIQRRRKRSPLRILGSPTLVSRGSQEVCSFAMTGVYASDLSPSSGLLVRCSKGASKDSATFLSRMSRPTGLNGEGFSALAPLVTGCRTPPAEAPPPRQGRRSGQTAARARLWCRHPDGAPREHALGTGLGW